MIFMQIRILSFQRIDLVSLLLFTIIVTKNISDSIGSICALSCKCSILKD